MQSAENYCANFFLQIDLVDGAPRLIGERSGIRGHRLANAAHAEPEGVFVEWSWDGAQLKVRNDRYGFFPVYYFVNAQKIVVSDSIDRVLGAGVSREFDDAAIAAFLRLGHYLGDDTPFRSVKMLGPGGTIDWCASEFAVAGAPRILAQQSSSRVDAMAVYRDLFSAAIARRAAPQRQLIVPLSGGRDSRHIVLELCRQEIVPDACVTARYAPGVIFKNEVEVAKRVCAALGVRHETVAFRSSRMAAEREKNRLTNYATLEHGWFMPVADRIAAGGAVTYDGMAGDVLSAGHFLTVDRHRWFREGNFRALFLDMQVALIESSIAGLLTKDAARRFNLEIAIERFARECRLHVSAPNPIGSFSIFNRTRRVACLCAYGLQPTIKYSFSPYLDNAVFDFLSSLPVEMFFDFSFHTDMIRFAFPKTADIPFAVAKPGGNYFSGYRTYARDVLGATIKAPQSQLLQKTFTIPRLLRCLVDPSYSPSAEWLGDISVYLLELERASAGRSAV